MSLPFATQSERMPRRSLLFLCVAMVLAVAPLVVRVPLWACALLLSAAFGRFLAERWLGGWWLWMLGFALFGSGVGAALFHYNTIVGLEPGTVIMLVLLSLKFLEAKSTRDFRVLVLLGYFLCLTTLFFSQDFLLCVYIGGVFAVLTAALVHLQLAGWGQAEHKLWPATRLSLILLAQATPVIVLLFLFFPRLEGIFRFQSLNSEVFDKTGMSDDMEPGSIAGVVTSTKVAFRADFPEGDTPPAGSLYWRGVVLWDENGLHWTHGSVPAFGRHEPLTGKLIKQRITLEPHGRRWLFALDRPATSVPGATYTSGGALESFKPITSTFRYEVGSMPENHEIKLTPLEKASALQTRGVSTQVRQLVASWRGKGRTDREVVDSALRFFREERFVYSLTPGGYANDSLDEFLFRRRSGFCEHYAASFATMMRVAKIPARVVLGYLGGNEGFGGYVSVPESDAHAWAEVWLPDYGWLHVDPTAVVAPERVASGLESFLESAAASSVLSGRAGASTGLLGIRDVLRDIQLAWDGLNYQWDLKVMGFDEQTQRNFLNVSGLGNPTTMRLLLRTFMVIGILLTFIGGWMHFSSRAPLDKVLSIYQRFCRRTAAAGLRRAPSEGPLDFRRRALEQFPAQAEEIGNIFQLYIRLRYGADGADRDLVRRFALAVRGFRLRS